jgi:twitching motility protein PilT
VILIGEMRDLETIALALTAAETGHLVFGTLHTSSAPKTVDRIIDVFPAGQQSQIRTMLAESLEAVVAQTLLKKKGGGRVAACEILIGTPAVRNLIREGKLHQIPSMMQTGRNVGMQTLDTAIAELAKKGLVDPPAPCPSLAPGANGAAAGAPA